MIYLASPFVLQDDCGNSDLSDAEKVCAECGQQRPLPWEECIFLHRMKQCVKIGEGTFGEVFSTTNASGETVALKVGFCIYLCLNLCPFVYFFLVFPHTDVKHTACG